MEFNVITTKEELKTIENMAKVCWTVTYKDILSFSQIDYMIKKFLVVDSTYSAMETDGYVFVVLKDNNTNIGFMSYKLYENELFLSKLYILPEHQKKGYGRRAILHLLKNNLPIKLTVNKYNRNAYNAYSHMGFNVLEAVKTDIGNGYFMDDYIMYYNK